MADIASVRSAYAFFTGHRATGASARPAPVYTPQPAPVTTASYGQDTLSLLQNKIAQLEGALRNAQQRLTQRPTYQTPPYVPQQPRYSTQTVYVPPSVYTPPVYGTPTYQTPTLPTNQINQTLNTFNQQLNQFNYALNRGVPAVTQSVNGVVQSFQGLANAFKGIFK